MLKGKIISAVYRHGENEVLIQFTDGTRFFIDKNQSGLELSITAAEPEI